MYIFKTNYEVNDYRIFARIIALQTCLALFQTFGVLAVTLDQTRAANV